MTKLIVFLWLMPLLVQAQKLEVRLSTGFDFSDNMTINNTMTVVGLKAVGSTLVNIRKNQFGIGFERGPETFENFAQPYLFYNWRLSQKSTYLYLGAMTGGILTSDRYLEKKWAIDGYSVGAQGGIIIRTGKHFGINSEICARRAVIWLRKDIRHFFAANNYPINSVSYYFSALIGVRYLF